MVEDTQDQQIVKYGYTQDTKTTLKRHQDSYGEDFNYIHALECKEHYKLENKIQNHNDLSTRHVKKYNGKDRQELLRLDKNFSVKNLIDLIANLKTTMDSDRELELKEIELDQDKERTKQKEEETKQLQIQLEIKKLELEMKKLEIAQNQQNTSSSSSSTSEQPPVEEDKKEVVKKFMNTCTEFATRSNYIFIDVLFDAFENWFQERNPGMPTPLSKMMFSRTLSSIPNYSIIRIATGPRVNNVTPRKVGLINRKFV
jgi:hypothetical protein